METDANIIIEVVNCSEIPDDELAEFTETKPIKLEDVKPESQEILIKKYVNGEVSFPAFYTTLEGGDDEDETKLLSSQDANGTPTTTNLMNAPMIVDTKTTIITDLDSPQKREKRTGGGGGGGGGGSSSGGGGARRRSNLNPALQGLMGEANLCFARGQNEMTEKICLEIIRQNPLAPEPFFTLAQIYETKDIEKFLNFSTIAAHLDPGNRDQWIRIAEINIENKNYQQARIHYSKAMRHLSKDFDIRLKKAKLLEMMGEHRDAMITYLKMIPLVPAEHGELCLMTAKKVARFYYDQKKMQIALEAMLSAYAIVPLLFMCEDINLFLELLIINKNFDIALTVLRDRYAVNILIELSDTKVITIPTCIIPDTLIPEFLSKLCVCVVHCKAFHLIDYMLTKFCAEIPIDSGIELYMDFAEALMNEDKNDAALKLLNRIVKSESFTAPPYVWLRLAECHYALGMIEDSIDAYYKVVGMAPVWYDAKFTLSALLKQQGRHREAIKVLEQDMDSESINPRLLYERCLMLETVGEIDEYIEVGYVLLSRKSLKFRSREEMIACSKGGNSFNAETYRSIVQTRFEPDSSEPEYNETEANLSIDEEYDLFRNLACTTFKLKKFGKLQKLSIAIATSKRFRSKYREIEKIIMIACLYNDDPLISFYFFREILTKNINNNNLWNFLVILIQIGDETRYHRFLKRIFDRQACSKYLKILLANYHLISGSYKYALNIYVPILKEFKDPLASLCIGVCFTQISLQKNSLKKSTGVAHAIAFVKKYAELRMSPITKQEINYNLGRIHHQAGAIHLAMFYYQEGLKATNSIREADRSILGLEQEIAFNIHLIYKESGNIMMARKYLYKYIKV